MQLLKSRNMLNFRLSIVLAILASSSQVYPAMIPKITLKLDQKGPIFKPVTTHRQKIWLDPSTSEVEIQPDITEINRDLTLKEGDIRQRKEGRNTLPSPTYEDLLWPKTIPVTYDNSISLLAKAAIDETRREYELRTCLTLPERTDEENYITFTSLSGCWSYVGMNGGSQNISIGPGCEKMATIEHEIMHALGIWHEQSRADRNDYVEIVWDHITEGKEHNFDNYPYNETDNRRVPYDYNSVMHYSKYSFTNDGNVTIQARDPAFEDVIGQRCTFSTDDVTKINRMYDCSDTVRVSNHVNFDEDNVGGFSQYGLDSEVEWLVHNVKLSDGAGATTRYLPTFDATLGIEGEGSFMYFDTSSRYPDQPGLMKSMRYTTTVAHQCLEFWYYMNINSNSQAAMTVYVATLDNVTGDITSYGSPIQTFAGSYGKEWKVHRMTISAPSVYRIVFYAKTGGYYDDVIAIDDVSVQDKECDIGYFTASDYTEKANTYGVDEAIISETMYTGHPGYAYQAMIYPNGSQSAVDAGYTDYLGFYFRLVGGVYDDQLEWPFDKQFVRLVITDQGPNPQTRMNYYYNFLTSKDSTLKVSWEKPTGLGVSNKPVGYRTFMPKYKMYTRQYLRHDMAYYSVQITDMRLYEGSTEISAKMSNPVLRLPSSIANIYQPKPFDVDSDSDPGEGDLIVDHDPNYYDGMISVKSAAIIVTVTTGIVFLIMAFAICAIAMSNRKKLQVEYTIMNNIRYVGPSPGETMKYKRMKGRI